MASRFNILDLTASFGCEISGLNVAVDIPEAIARQLRALWLKHGILLFRRIGTSPEIQLRLSRCFGELEPHPIPKFRHPDYPELILLGNADGPTGPVYDYGEGGIHGKIPWHTDLAFKTTPNAGALLRMVTKPAHGGQTGWLDMALAHDGLDDATKAEIAGLEAVYVFRAGLEEMRFANPGGVRLDRKKDEYPNFPPIAAPLVWTHPETGLKMLNLNLLNIDHVHGLPREDGDALIERLIAHIDQPRFQYLHDWEVGDMMLWDNRRTLHCAPGHPVGQIRTIHRTTIKGNIAMGRELETA